MKKLLTFTLILLAVLFVFPLSACDKIEADRYVNAQSFTADSAFSYGNEINHLIIDWEISEVNVEVTDGDEFVISESYSGSDDSERMHYYAKGATLYVEFWQSGKRGTIDENQKILTVQIPKTLTTLEIEADDADVNAQSIYANVLEIETDRGNVNIGDINASITTIDTENGNITLDLNGKGAKINFESDRGSLNTSLTNDKLGLDYTFGDGALRIKIETDSGDLTVK